MDQDDPSIPTAKLVLDQDADIHVLPPGYSDKLDFANRRGRLVPIYPKGTEFSGDHAVLLVRNGQAAPTNAACEAACGMTSDQITAQHVEYKMDSLGIHSKKDRDLYKQGVILGYDENLKTIPGPNWNKFQAAQAAIQKTGNV